MASQENKEPIEKPQLSQADFTRQNLSYFHEPRFTIKDLQAFIENITYRKINDWNSKNLISGSRENKEAGWRKFSIVDILKLMIIADLKNIGLGADKIFKIMSGLEKYPIREMIPDSDPIKFKHIDSIGLEYNMVSAWAGDKLMLVINDKLDVSFSTEKDFAICQLHFHNLLTPRLLLPFFEYVHRAFSFLRMEIKIDPRTTIAHLLNELMSYTERQIVNILRNKDFSEIKITRPNSKAVTVRAKINEKGNFNARDVIDAINKKDYQNIQVSRVNGQIVAVSREETFKV